MRKIMEIAGIEFCDKEDNKSFNKVDTRIIIHLFAKAMPVILEAVIPDKKATIKDARNLLQLPRE
ncbi:hypothetical protein H7X65_03655 [Candidatus Parcubacteria bacterium]|nr:hypothetical protein [Candidatus Parcubacteria bacterium]